MCGVGHWVTFAICVDSKKQRVGLIENFEAAANYELQVSLSVCLSPSLFTAALSNDL